VKKEQYGRKSLRRLKPTVGCNASKRRRRRMALYHDYRGHDRYVQGVGGENLM
jgi:hypothetical protein